MNFEYLTKPIIIGNYIVKNRVVVPPMANFVLRKGNGKIKPEHLDFYEKYAVGGAGLIIIEACSVIKTTDILSVYDDECIYGMSQLAKCLSKKGAVVIVQLIHEGLSILKETEISQISKNRFLEYKKMFIDAAVRCKKAGFAGIELHAAHGFYLNQILERNSRTDEYGGTFENRVRIVQELIAEIKKTCGKDFIVSVRFGNQNLSELKETAIAIEKSGADLLNISTGCGEYQNIPLKFPFDNKIYASSLVKNYVHIPVVCVGNITNGAQAETILKNNYADMVAVGRGHLCDPSWTNKVISGEQPITCKNCRICMWYIDGKKCPAKRKEKMNK